MNILWVFLLGSILGFIWEACISGRPKFNFGLPLLFIYGFGFVGIYLIGPSLRKYSICIRYLIYVILITIFEYTAGKTMERIRGKKTWKYSNGNVISLKTSLGWGILALLVESFLVPENRNNR